MQEVNKDRIKKKCEKHRGKTFGQRSVQTSCRVPDASKQDGFNGWWSLRQSKSRQIRANQNKKELMHGKGWHLVRDESGKREKTKKKNVKGGKKGRRVNPMSECSMKD